MKIKFHLFSHERDALRANLPAGCSALISLNNATLIDISGEKIIQPDLSIVCEEDDAKQILEAAKKCCSDALPRLNTAFRLKSR
jgi:hypothetical protein